MSKNNPYYNNEGYADPTAFYGTKQIVKEEAETERRANELIKVLKFIIRSCGFELIERVKIKDTKTGKEFKGWMGDCARIVFIASQKWSAMFLPCLGVTLARKTKTVKNWA